MCCTRNLLLRALSAGQAVCTTAIGVLMSHTGLASSCSDFLSTMPKQHLERALEVAHLFAAQKSAINISLSAIGLLWNATDLLGRSRAAAAAAAASTATNTPPMTPSGLQGALSTVFSMLTRKSSTLDEATSAVLASAVAASKPGSTSSSARATTVAGVPDVVRSVSRSAGGTSTDADGYQDPHLAGRSDLSEDECTELLLKLFKHLRKISMDLRPEVSLCSCWLLPLLPANYSACVLLTSVMLD